MSKLRNKTEKKTGIRIALHFSFEKVTLQTNEHNDKVVWCRIKNDVSENCTQR